MTIYPLDERIEQLLASFVDEETGEVLFTEEEMNKQLDDAQVEFNQAIVSLRNEFINKSAEDDALKTEKMKLEKRQKVAKNAADRAKRFLAYLLKGEKFSDGVCKISYRSSEGLVVDDRESLMAWAIDHDRFLKAPELCESDIKTAISNGENIPYAHIEKRQNIQVK